MLNLIKLGFWEAGSIIVKISLKYYIIICNEKGIMFLNIFPNQSGLFFYLKKISSLNNKYNWVDVDIWVYGFKA